MNGNRPRPRRALRRHAHIASQPASGADGENGSWSAGPPACDVRQVCPR